MEKNVISPVSGLDSLRESTVADIMRGYGATRTYAEGLTQYLGAGWFEFEFNDKSESAKPTLEEGAKFRKALKEAGHSNPSVAWTRVRAEGKKLVAGETETETETGEGEGDAPGAKNVRSIKLRYIEELATLYKAGKREQVLADDVAQALVHISSALGSLGVDLNTLK